MFLIFLKLFAQLFVLQPLRFVGLTDGVLAAVGALFWFSGAAEEKMALITDKNHFYHQGASISAFPLIINYKFPQERAAQPLYFYTQRRGIF